MACARQHAVTKPIRLSLSVFISMDRWTLGLLAFLERTMSLDEGDE
jgi:hypothetical protein